MHDRRKHNVSEVDARRRGVPPTYERASPQARTVAPAACRLIGPPTDATHRSGNVPMPRASFGCSGRKEHIGPGHGDAKSTLRAQLALCKLGRRLTCSP
jgi:hypothetical protein